MKAEYVNSFYKATKDVFNLMMDLDPQIGELKALESMKSDKETNILLGVIGDLKGEILFSFPLDMTLEMIKIMSGMEMDKIDSFASSALGEIANIIGGNATTNLTEHNYTCDILPPKVFIGKYKGSSTNNKVLQIPLMTSIGEFDINVFLTENK
ncbi:chemotaxis protein CheX [Defluviitalea phaphyphila]|uniref:chemotaxis protein CheX n=1 Tax=Defluviitalea phaphyphila TaxID=1473580 RepID=UPI00072FC164|nr:chemotaxis protein CheX [Defluviitalea phaphyphila]